MFVVLALVVASLASCGGDDDTKEAGSVTVLAASSLTEAFTELGAAFEEVHDGVRVTFSFAASSALAEQVNQGGPGDVLVTADAANMQKVLDAGNAKDPTVIATNRLALLVEKGNPEGITGLDDLARDDIVFVLCADAVPCGKYGARALDLVGIDRTPASLEENVKAVVAKVTLGEADAGIVYVTDVQAVGDKAEGIDIDVADDPDLIASYPIALLSASTQASLGRAWIDFVLSDAGREILRSHGFGTP
jgi:molybdate transport system substrate-binding protein